MAILTKDPDFYRAYEDEQEDSGENLFIKILFMLLILVGLISATYFTYNYLVDRGIVQKIDFLSTEELTQSSVNNKE